MGLTLTHKLIEAHLVDGEMQPGSEVGLRIDQTLTQDATGTLVMLELEAMGLERVRTELSAQYVDHNLLETDHRNPDDHVFLRTACAKYGIWYSPAGGGVSHPVHMERFGRPSKTLLGSDSHTPAAGALGMLAIGAGGLEVALAMAGEPFYVAMPRVRRVVLTGELPAWVSAKDVILELLRRHGVAGAIGEVLEYSGPGLASLTAMDRHVIANMGTELGATTTVFPSDAETARFLTSQGRTGDWLALSPDPGAVYDSEETIDLAGLEPLIALPSSPGNVVPVREVAGREIYQAMIGSSANPGVRDFAVPALMVSGRTVHPRVSFDVNPTSRQVLSRLVAGSYLGRLIEAGARVHQAGCNGCIGMGQAPASGRISLRTVPRNFPGRSGTREDQVYLCSPETATASALMGVITDPRTLELDCPRFVEPEEPLRSARAQVLVAPLDEEQARTVTLEKGPNIQPLPRFEPLPERLAGPVLLKVGDDVSTDEILPAGAAVLPYRSNIPKISTFCFWHLDDRYASRALAHKEQEGGRGRSFIVAGENYGQGSSREHAAVAPRYLGVAAVIARSFARLHRQNLANYGILPLVLADPADYDRLEMDGSLVLEDARGALQRGGPLTLFAEAGGARFEVEHGLSARQVDVVLAGGMLAKMRERMAEGAAR